MKDELCDVCRITYVDTLEPSAKWAARHKTHRQRQARRNPGRTPVPNCEWAREANRLYLADYNGRSRERKRVTPERPSEYVSAASICDVCGITADAAPSEKFRTRHQRAGAAPCEAALESRRVNQRSPRLRARAAKRERERRRRLNREREAGLMPDDAHGRSVGREYGCKCAECRALGAARSAAQRRKRASEAAERRAGLDSETDVPLDEDGLDEEEVELERRLAS